MGPSRRIAFVSQAVCGALGLVAAAAAEPLDSSAGDPAADAVLATLPFDPASRASTILIDLAPKGNARKLPFQLDTGATSSLVSPRLARSMGVKVSRTRLDPYRRRTALGRDVHFYVDTRRGDTASSVGIEYGVLGGDFLSHYVVELDFAQHRVRFFDPERYEVPAASQREGEAVLPLTLVANRPGLTLSLDGHPVEVLVDTGAQFGLMLSGEIAESAGIAFEPLPGLAIQGVVGRVEGHVGEVARLEIGPFAFERVAAPVAPNGFFNLGFPGDSLLGYDLLAQFLVRIDYPRRRLWLRRNETAAPLPDPRRPETQRAMSWTIPPEPADALRAEPPRDTRARQVWLEWRTPAAGTRVEGPVGWAAVEGWAGVGLPIRHDVVIAIDVSGSTAVASGADVDGDGSVGKQRRRLESWRTFNPHHLSSDVGDTVLAAEIAAARRLIEVLDPDRTRIGIVAFSDTARILAPLGSERERIERVLHDLDQAFGSGATHLAAAIARGAEALRLESSGPEARRRTLIVLSDGWPTAPGSLEAAAQQAYDAARSAARDGVRIDTFGLGLAGVGDQDVYALIAKASGGRYRPLAEPGSIVHELPRIDLADVAAVEISNASTGSPGRAVRVLPDGSFDGIVLLDAGENRIRVTARDADGHSHSDERVVSFDRRAPRDAEEAARFERRLAKLRQTLEQRRVEVELIAEIQEARGQRRELEVSAEP